ncbi:MAG TPA: DsbA family protein [Spirochaetota bacterium]|nr:DsbA family protein [Spirochaetota bacterium]
MKKYTLLLIALSLAGAVISGVMVAGHYNPGIQERLIACGDALDNPCRALGLSGYAEILGAPIALFGLFYYLFMLFTLLAADYAGGRYYGDAICVLLPLALLSLAANMVLAALLVRLDLFCTLCVSTYAVNLLSAVALYLLWRETDRGEKQGMRESYRKLFRMPSTNDGRAVFSIYLLFTFFLFIAVFSAGGLIKSKAPGTRIPRSEIAEHVNAFYSTVPETAELPESALTLGEGGLTISVFTDFLCGACYQFYEVEKDLFARYRGRIRVAYYHYPLDRSCNPNVRSSRYPGSCAASRAMIAASQMGIFREYFLAHFGNFERVKRGFSPDAATATAAGLADSDEFTGTMNSRKTDELLARDLELARRLGIHATPTIIIGGRRLEGVPPAEILFGIIDREFRSGKGTGAKPR